MSALGRSGMEVSVLATYLRVSLQFTREILTVGSWIVIADAGLLSVCATNHIDLFASMYIQILYKYYKIQL